MAPLRLHPALPIAFLVLGILAVPAHAGTAKAPEITDPANDQAATANGSPLPAAPCNPGGTGQPPATNGCFQNADLLAGWVDTETPTSFQLHAQVSGTAAPSTLGTAYTWDVHFTIGATAYVATAHLNGLTTGGAAGPLDGALTFSGAAKSGSAVNSVVTFNILKADVGMPAAGTHLSQLWMDAQGLLASQGVTYEVSDRAPDTASGTDYVLTGGAAIRTVMATVATTPLSIIQGFANATSATYVYNWTQGPANATISLRVHGTGNATVVVRDAANATLLSAAPRNATLSTNVTGKAGRWVVTLNYTAFKGNLTLSIEPRAAPPLPTGTTSTSRTGATTRTSTSTTTSKGTPGLGVSALAGALAAAGAAARRRRHP